MSIFNEEDIVVESVSKLYESGVLVYILDNGSTDSSIPLLKKYCSHAIVGIEEIIIKESDLPVFSLISILERKEQLSKLLDFDWFMNVDADEIRYSPWPGMSLSDSIKKVNSLGYNLIDFRLFNFRLTENLVMQDDYESSMTHYSNQDGSNTWHLKAWKKNQGVDLKTHGGHIAIIENPRIFPIKFIHKHYPFRSVSHAKRKILTERKNRFSRKELEIGWHVHYNKANIENLDKIVWPNEDLKEFELISESDKLRSEALENILNCGNFQPFSNNEIFNKSTISILEKRFNITSEDATQFFNTALNLINLILKNEIHGLNLNAFQYQIMLYLIQNIATHSYYNGNPFILTALDKFQSKFNHLSINVAQSI